MLREYVDLYYTGDVLAYYCLHFDHLARAAESGLYDCLAHPDIVKNVFPAKWKPMQILDRIRSSLDRIAKTGVAMELNTSGLDKQFPEMNPGRMMLQEMCERSIPVVIGGDAHVPNRAGENFGLALRTLQEVGYTHVHIVLQRKKQPIEIKAALATLREND